MAPAKLKTSGALRARRKFLRFFPAGFADESYIAWERGYKWSAHERWVATLDRDTHRTLVRADDGAEVARRAVAIESRTNLLFSFEKMALRDAVRRPDGSRAFAGALFDFLHGSGDLRTRFERWCDAVAGLPRRQTRVLTWPLVTVFAFIAQPETHIFFKPLVTRRAARAYGFELAYSPRPSWEVYASLLGFAEQVRRDTRDLGPRDMIDLQSFIWVQGSDEY
jgi:hypothetical protein